MPMSFVVVRTRQAVGTPPAQSGTGRSCRINAARRKPRTSSIAWSCAGASAVCRCSGAGAEATLAALLVLTPSDDGTAVDPPLFRVSPPGDGLVTGLSVCIDER